MSNDHQHQKELHEHKPGHHEDKGRRGPHKDWRVWTAVILMLAAMFAYVYTMEESEVPGGTTVPAMDDAEAE